MTSLPAPISRNSYSPSWTVSRNTCIALGLHPPQLRITRNWENFSYLKVQQFISWLGTGHTTGQSCSIIRKTHRKSMAQKDPDIRNRKRIMRMFISPYCMVQTTGKNTADRSENLTDFTPAACVWSLAWNGATKSPTLKFCNTAREHHRTANIG